MAKKSEKKQHIRIVEEWEPAKLQETLDELCDDGYVLHTILTLNNSKTYVVMIKNY